MFTAVKTFEVLKVKNAKKRFEFLSDGQPIADIDFPKKWHKAATLQANGNKWQVSRKGWWNTYYELISEQSPYTKWKVAISWRGVLTIRNDQNKLYTLKRKGFWKTCWVWLNEKEEPIIELSPATWSFKKSGAIRFATNPDSNLVWLALFGWFVVLCTQEDGAAAAAAA